MKGPEMHPQDIPMSKLLLDPNNYRLQEASGYSAVALERFSNAQIQERTFNLLKNEALNDLVRSIRANGFLPIERIVVTPYLETQDQFLVIEGNRRIAALMELQSEGNSGILLPYGLADIFNAVPCIVADQGENEFFKETLMGIRHVGGIRQWGGYQRAKLIADLRDNYRLDPNDVADRLGLSVNEVNRRYRAFKVLQQMQEDDEFGEFTKPTDYALFHEAVALPVVRDWLGFSNQSNTFENDDALRNFYELITPSYDEETRKQREAKIQSYLDVRNLRPVLANEEAKGYLLDPSKTLLDAQTIARRDELSQQWRTEVSEAITALTKIGAIEVERFTADEVGSLNALIDAANSILRIHAAITNG